MTQPPNRQNVIKDCCSLIDDEVKAKSGFSGIAIKTAYGIVKTFKPGFVTEVVDGLLDEWAEKLRPFYEAWEKGGASGAFADYLMTRPDEAAQALLEVTDKRAQKSSNGVVRKMYDKNRSSAKDNVVKALPRLGAMVEKVGKA
jgi:hypothetical protein